MPFGLYGKPFFIKGINYSINYPGKKSFKEIPFSVFEKDFQDIKDAGFNTIRTDFTAKAPFEKYIQEAVSIIQRDKNRKCILMWALWNDAPFQWGTKGNVTKRYKFHKVKEEDPTRPVTGSNTLNATGCQAVAPQILKIEKKKKEIGRVTIRLDLLETVK